MMNRLTLAAFATLASLAVACSDDAAPVVDARPIDAPIDATATIDAPMVVAGDLCSNAEPITLTAGAATISGTTAAPFTHNYEVGACAKVNSLGNDRVHSITIPVGERLTATVDPTSAMFDPGIFLVAGPAGNCDAMPIVCLASNDTGGDGADDAITYDNTGAAAAEVFIIIDGFRADGEPYTLNVTVGPIPA